MSGQAAERANVSGWFEGVRHVYPVRVYYEDTDAAGIVYHANYLRFAERARTEMMRCLGTEHRSLMQSDGVAFAVRSLDTEFFQPARLDDPLTVDTRVDGVGGASMRLSQTVMGCVEETWEPVALVQMAVRLACIDGDLRPARLPRVVRAALSDLVKDQ
ncbi:MAG: tol-pal system-associated acyl-CoA thioesterase [Rhodospirillaceae bacterium]|jgi:acyl-CoA thioester hydrolase|nr:tol-pal system-associated acyl-CoA thioesterase [Rhodospirillaceae bacterium]MBT5943593.1 tol-pal system-associated acyl-CoA thioesterase [Rhodospirillaceae bacterium]MBT6405930.1 tol-pal system-associated acyl-CoA thioesterase [Rhodospirillaceae bacterium]MBT6535868.1 tol-pal system-associated acyl-CoA thioesterase [Rhodospirillaceae bacterium]MBT7362744.1 tol-pal system-associated acyl-CoA thioesterase [Rhodospirillaceae bacterium]